MFPGSRKIFSSVLICLDLVMRDMKKRNYDWSEQKHYQESINAVGYAENGNKMVQEL